jgi:PAS domain-containing protein
MSDMADEASPEQRYHAEMSDTELKLSIRSLPELMRASHHAELQSLGLLSALDNDPRPTFAVDVASEAAENATLNIAYYNSALDAMPQLIASIQGGKRPNGAVKHALEPRPAFHKWIWGKTDVSDPAVRGMVYLFGEHLWCVVRVAHYSIVSGLPITLFVPELSNGTPKRNISLVSLQEHGVPKNRPQFVSERLPATAVLSADGYADTSQLVGPPTTQTYGPFDYTLEVPPAQMTDHVKFFRSVDWAATSLGPLHTWNPRLRCLVNMMLNDKYPTVLFWGSDVIMIYNEAYVELIGVLHPCMGQSARVAAEEYWPLFQPIVDHVNATGETYTNDCMPLFLDRHGFLEEAYFSFQFTPILDDAGYISGYIQPLVEITQGKLIERRISNLVEVGSQTAKARDLSTFWHLVLNTLAINEKDVPFALLYAAEHHDAPGISCVSTPGSMSDPERYVLKGSIGVDSDHLVSPSVIDFKDASSIYHSYLVNAIRTRMPIVAHFSDLNMPDDGLANIDWKGYGDACRSVVICPVLPTTGEQVQGFLILGINPRRPFDEDYQQFVHVMLRLLATSLASVVLFDEEMRQKENAIGQAARIQEQLVAQLQLKEKKFQRYADGSDVGIFVLNTTGNYTYRNKSWYNMFEATVGTDTVFDIWKKIVWPEDIPVVEAIFANLVVDKVAIGFELRTSMPWHPPDDSTESESETQPRYKWILCSAYPELDENSNLIEIVGNVTDISKQKWAEELQKLKTDSALQSKRHLEHFIDTTSHEMRNPLSAIVSNFPARNTSETYTDFVPQCLDAVRRCHTHILPRLRR